MALKATIYKAELQIADMDRNYYQEHLLTLARHPSETDERMMTRILAFAMHSSDTLAFGRGLSNVEEPDLIDRDLTGAIELWIEIGLPDERAILKACGRARKVVVFVYGHSADLWWKGIEAGLARARNLTVLRIASVESRAIEAMAQRAMNLQATIQDGIVWFSDATTTVELHPELLRSPA